MEEEIRQGRNRNRGDLMGSRQSCVRMINVKFVLFVLFTKRMNVRVLVGKPVGKRPLGRPRRRWVDNIRMDLQEVGCGDVDWTGLG